MAASISNPSIEGWRQATWLVEQPAYLKQWASRPGRNPVSRHEGRQQQKGSHNIHLWSPHSTHAHGHECTQHPSLVSTLTHGHECTHTHSCAWTTTLTQNNFLKFRYSLPIPENKTSWPLIQERDEFGRMCSKIRECINSVVKPLSHTDEESGGYVWLMGGEDISSLHHVISQG